LAPAANGDVKLFQTSNVTIFQNKHCCSPYLKTGSTHASNYLKTGSTHASNDGTFALFDLPDREQLLLGITTRINPGLGRSADECAMKQGIALRNANDVDASACVLGMVAAFFVKQRGHPHSNECTARF
jgi:hypothetical protein